MVWNKQEVMDRLRDESGFNLVEVLLAAALLGTVLISVVAMFVLGGQNVKSGRELTKATALGMEIMEDFRRMGFDQAYGVIGGSCTQTTLEWRSKSGSNSDPARIGIPGSDLPTGCEFPANWSYLAGQEDNAGILCRWAMNARSQFHSGSEGAVRVKVDGFDSIPASEAASADGDTIFCGTDNARYLRIRVMVEWAELSRKRDVTFETLKF